MSTRSWMRRVGAAMAVGCVLASLGGGSAATATVAAVPSTPWAWGYNIDGELGDGTTTSSNTPVQVSGLSMGAIAIAGGDRHSLAVKSDRTVWAWGYNNVGQLGNGTTTDSHTPVQVSGLSGVTAIAADYSYSLAVKSDGTVWAWGDSGAGELGNGTTTDSHTPVPVSGSGDPSSSPQE